MRKIHLHAASGLPTHGGPEANKYPQLSASSHPASTQPVALVQNPLILVIDDSLTVRKIVETCLRREGFEVKSFPDGIAAIRWLTEPEARIPRLIILDIGLPKLDGYDVARRLKAKAQFHQTVIIMLSRRDGIIDKLKGRLAGAQDYLVKPFKTQDLISVAKAHIRREGDSQV